MKKLVFGITGLTLGGAERVLVDIANELANKYEITIFTIYGRGEFEKELSEKVKLINMIDLSYNELTKIQKICVSLKILFNKKSIYNKYIKNKFDTEVAFLEGPITRLFSVKNKNVKKVVWVHNDIGQVFGKSIKGKLKRNLDKSSYAKYNSIVFVSEDNKKSFEKTYNLENKKYVIFNYISLKRITEKSNEQIEEIYSKDNINFLTVARLTEQKAIDRLIKVHSELIENGLKHKFYIIGDGPERKKLEQLIIDYKVQDTFKLLGSKVNPYPYIKQCDIFALLSNYEGLPITVLEAKALDKPIVITNTAAREAVINYNKSIVVNNSEDGIYKGIEECLNKISEWEKIHNKNDVENTNIISEIEKLVN